MPAEIIAVEPNSPAARAGLRAGDALVAIDGHAVHDVLDYKFYGYEPSVTVETRRGGEPHFCVIRKCEGEDLGLTFASYLIDEQKGCCNRCVFCFIDQLPPGMRRTLYFKDDDARLSFLMGNYISMTNLSDEDAARIARMRVSPLNISVHTTNPELRTRMLGNPNGGASLRHLYYFAQQDIAMQCQIVVCPGYNDGDELRRTLRELSALHPAVRGVAVVPVGLTRFRERLPHLEPVDRDGAHGIIAVIDEARAANMQTHGTPLCFAADELYLKAGLPIPAPEYYDNYAQLENGVGLMSLFESELRCALAMEEKTHIAPFAVATGRGAADFMRRMIDEIAKRCDNEMQYEVFAVRNDFFGEGVNVAGLVTGGDIIAQLCGKITAKRLLVPRVMLRHGETVFLDDVSISDMEQALGVTVIPVEIDGGMFLDAVLERQEEWENQS